MFNFGDPVDTARMQLDMYINGSGPGVPDLHIDEMSEQELRNLMAYLHAALRLSYNQGQEAAVIDVLTEWYDEVFVTVARASERFRERVKDGNVQPPGRRSDRAKYYRLAKEASES